MPQNADRLLASIIGYRYTVSEDGWLEDPIIGAEVLFIGAKSLDVDQHTPRAS